MSGAVCREGETARLGLVVDREAAAAGHQSGRHAWWLAAVEFVEHLRLEYDQLDRLPVDDAELAEYDVLLLASPQELTDADGDALERWTQSGGTVITGPRAELDTLTGARSIGRRYDQLVTIGEHGAFTAPPPRPLRAVSGDALATQAGVESLASWSDGTAAISHRPVGAGSAITLGVDLWQSVVTIQQGRPVTGDGLPATDGTAPIDDDILKCEDGMALSFEADRALPPGSPPVPHDYTHTYPPANAVPIFDQPQADQWWITLAQLIWWAREQQRGASVWLHYWPAGTPAIAHMSHDSDLNNTDDAEAALATFDEADVSVTWCQVFPGGYRSDIYPTISARGHEHALHFNAMGDADIASWGWPHFRAQYAWAQAVTGCERIVSNKNHYTRWEDWVDFYRWCEHVGIEIDESRGPSKQGSIGFPFGTAHVSFPIGDIASANRPMNVLNLPLHTQDLAWAGHLSVRDPILDGATEVHGVAHFLFHGPHLRGKPATRAACVELARVARERGMRWWTASQINSWERARRGIDLRLETHETGWVLRVRSSTAVDGVGILLQLPPDADVRAVDPGVTLTEVVRHGRRFLELAADLPAGASRWQLDLK